MRGEQPPGSEGGGDERHAESPREPAPCHPPDAGQSKVEGRRSKVAVNPDGQVGGWALDLRPWTFDLGVRSRRRPAARPAERATSEGGGEGPADPGEGCREQRHDESGVPAEEEAGERRRGGAGRGARGRRARPGSRPGRDRRRGRPRERSRRRGAAGSGAWRGGGRRGRRRGRRGRGVAAAPWRAGRGRRGG